MSKLIFAFIRRETLIEKVYKFHMLARVAEGLVKIGIFYFIGKYLSPDYFAYVFVGILFGRTFYFFVSAPVDFIKHEQHWGTIEPLIAAPHDFTKIIFSASVAKTIVFFFIEIAAYLLGAAAGGLFDNYGFDDAVGIAARFAPYLFVSSALFWSFGVFVAAASIKIKRIEQVLWFGVSAVEIMSGVYFPTEKLPEIFYLKKIAATLPTTDILGRWRSIILNNGRFDAGAWIIYACVATLCIVASITLFKKSFLEATKKGDILNY